MWGGGFNRLPIQIFIKAALEETIDHSCEGCFPSLVNEACQGWGDSEGIQGIY